VNQVRRGGIFFRLIAMLMVVSVAGVLCWAALNYQRTTGTWAFHPLDPAWWSPARAAGAPANGKDAMDDARFIGDQMGQALWGKGGLIERADAWWGANESSITNKSSDSPTGGSASQQSKTSVDKDAPKRPPVANSSVQGQLELRFARADADFQLGLNDLKAASPIAGDASISNVDRLARVGAARERFVAVERELAQAIPAYENLQTYDSRTAGTAPQLRQFNRQMLELTGGVPTSN
jgi:hypothetical protein